MHVVRLVTAALGAIAMGWLAGCSPALDWREVRPPGRAVVVEMPCRPDRQERPVALAGPAVPMVLQVCDADGLSWALASADVGDPARVAPALAALLDAAAANLGVAPGRHQPFAVQGAPALAGSARLHLKGQRPQGPTLEMDVAVFARGTRVYQLTALGPMLPAAAVETFLGSVRVEP